MTEPEQASEASKLILDLQRRIASLQQILGQTLQQQQMQELRLAQSGASELAHSEHMRVLDRSVSPITRDLNDFQSRKRICEKRIRLEETESVPADCFFGHVYLDTSDQQLALATYSDYVRFVRHLSLKLVTEDLPVIGSWIRNILVKIDRSMPEGNFEERLREISRNQFSAGLQLLETCQKISQCVFQIGPLVLIKYVDAEKTTCVGHTLDAKQISTLQDDPSVLNKPRDLAKSLGFLEHSLNILS